MTLVSGKIKLPFIWKRVCLINDFLLVQTMICNHLYTFSKIFQKHVLGGIKQSDDMGTEAFSSLLPVLQYLSEAEAHTAHTLVAARSTSHKSLCHGIL